MALKRRLIAAAILLLIAAGASGGSAWLGYAHRASQAAALNREMLAIFHNTFPGEPVVVEVPLQMAAKVKTVEDRLRLIGTQGSQSALAVLREVSRLTPPETRVDISDFNYTADSLRLEGTTANFDAVNRLAKELGSSPLFSKVQITDSKTSLAGDQIDFRMTLSLGAAQEHP